MFQSKHKDSSAFIYNFEHVFDYCRATSIGKSLLLIFICCLLTNEIKNSFGIPKRRLRKRASELAFTVNNAGMHDSHLMLLYTEIFDFVSKLILSPMFQSNAT